LGLEGPIGGGVIGDLIPTELIFTICQILFINLNFGACYVPMQKLMMPVTSMLQSDVSREDKGSYADFYQILQTRWSR